MGRWSGPWNPPSGRLGLVGSENVYADAAAFNLLFADLVERLLSLSDNPGRSSDFIARELRGLVGARTIMVYEFSPAAEREGPRLVSVFPERRRSLGSAPELAELLAGLRSWPGSRFLSAAGQEEESPLLAALGLGDCLILPLEYGNTRVGALLLLDLLDKTNLDSILETMKRLASLLALIQRNAQLYSRLEEEVRLRTAELEERKAQLETSLGEKEVLIQELHHRVKNNLQIVTGLLHLKSRAAPPGEVRSALEESESRVLAMSLVHEELYRAEDLAGIRMDDYLPRLVDRILDASGLRTSRVYELEPLELGLAEALPCGLIVNELVMNALRHGFSGRGGGRLRLALGRRGSELLLELEDDGPGLPEGAFGSSAASAGLEIVRSLAEQLHGELLLLEGPGARFRLTFPAPTPTL